MSITIRGLQGREGYSTNSIASSTNWNLIPTKGMTTKSKEELKKKIESLAAQEATATSKEELSSIMFQVEKLRTQYISTASPNRKQLFKDAASLIDKKSTSYDNGNSNRNLLDYLMKEDSQGNKLKNDVPQSIGNGNVTAIGNSAGGSDYLISVGNEQVMRIDTYHNKVTYVATSAEQKLNEEFNSIFFKVKNAVKNGTKPASDYINSEISNKTTLSELPDYLETKSKFEQLA